MRKNYKRREQKGLCYFREGQEEKVSLEADTGGKHNEDQQLNGAS